MEIFVTQYIKVLKCKVNIFWEGHKNVAQLSLFFWHYLVASNHKWKTSQIFVAFSEYLNFNT